LEDAEWGVYIAAVHTGEPLPESHDGDPCDGDEGEGGGSDSKSNDAV
jgi:hypothetical protein